MKNLSVNLKREYWEYRNLILGLPIIVSSLVVIAAVVANMAAGHFHKNDDIPVSLEQTESIDKPAGPSEAKPIEKESGQTKPQAIPPASDEAVSETEDEMDTVAFASFYISIAWLASFYYLLSSLYVDRRDKSILYWKSLPVSETQTVLTKLVIGSLGIVLVSLFFAWLTSLLLTVIGMGPSDFTAREWRVSLSNLLLKPIAVVVFGAVWGAPIFTYILMVSAMSKRLPFFLLILPPIVIFVLEGIFFRSSRLLSFVGSHLPHAVFEPISDSDDVGQVLSHFFIDNSGSLITGLIASVAFIVVAIWCRNHRFEI